MDLPEWPQSGTLGPVVHVGRGDKGRGPWTIYVYAPGSPVPVISEN